MASRLYQRTNEVSAIDAAIDWLSDGRRSSLCSGVVRADAAGALLRCASGCERFPSRHDAKPVEHVWPGGLASSYTGKEVVQS
jgi:hypothetical protein